MAKHGGSKHIKKKTVSVLLPVARKGAVWFKMPSPGPHPKKECIPLTEFIRVMLKIAKDAREAKALLKQGKIFVDGKPVKEEGFPVGLMDVVSVPDLGVFYRVVFSKNRLRIAEISKEDAQWKYCKVVGKRLAKKNMIQLTLHDGGNKVYPAGATESRLKPGDSLKIALPKREVKELLKQERNCLCYVYKGRHSGQTARMVEVLPRMGSQPNNALLESGGEKVVTLQDYLFVVDEKFLNELKKLS